MTKSRTITVYALMTALVVVATFAIKIPSVSAEGYLNLGDMLVLFCGIAFGPIAGLIAGGLGSSLADLLGGYAQWFLPTLLIKGAEGAVAGLLFRLFGRKGNPFLMATLAAIPAVILMVSGYFFASWIMLGNAAAAWVDVPGNLGQGGVGILGAILFLLATSKIKNISSIVGKNQFYDIKKEEKKEE